MATQQLAGETPPNALSEMELDAIVIAASLLMGTFVELQELFRQVYERTGEAVHIDADVLTKDETNKLILIVVNMISEAMDHKLDRVPGIVEKITEMKLDVMLADQKKMGGH